MILTPYLSITLPKSDNAAVTKLWLGLAVLSLAGAGILSILLVLLRTPGIEAIIPYHDFFHTALVAHVDLSVLVWMLSIGGLLWSTVTHPSYHIAARTAVILCYIGTALIAITPFTGESYPLMNNYIPVLQRLPFFLGLGFITTGVLFQTTIAIMSNRYILERTEEDKKGVVLEQAGIVIAAFITLIALLCFVLSSWQLNGLPIGNIQYFYEQLFWAGGHILQFSYTQLMLVVWLLLAGNSGLRFSLNERWLYLLLTLNLTVTLPSPLLYMFHKVGSVEHISFFTDQMRYMGGTAAAMIGIVLLVDIIRQRRTLHYSPPTIALLSSLALFGMGGILGHMIQGINVTIPAHYHGSIVGISLAFMGLIYYIAPKLGFGDIKGRMAFWQPIVYGGGQLIHITGLAWSGGYGALRKTPGAMLSIEAKAGMALMGFGGLIAVIGGIMFVVIALRSIMHKEDDK